jgi:HD-GYP domain-containing protein (c-di-GMP phosphodiesterase class II)
VKEAVQMHHERVNGKGYPRGIQQDSINPYAKIIGLVDTYEAMTNGRPYVEGMNAHKAVKFILSSLKGDFDEEVMKVFIDKMSVYPIGSIVRLDTRELARVVSVQPGSPLRPVVMVIRDANGEPVKERTIIDLSKQEFPSIQDSL